MGESLSASPFPACFVEGMKQSSNTFISFLKLSIFFSISVWPYSLSSHLIPWVSYRVHSYVYKVLGSTPGMSRLVGRQDVTLLVTLERHSQLD